VSGGRPDDGDERCELVGREPPNHVRQWARRVVRDVAEDACAPSGGAELGEETVVQAVQRDSG
jgi:hypothetical protein